MNHSEALTELVKQMTDSKESILRPSEAFSVKELEFAFEAQGFFVTLLDRAPIVSKETLLHALYQACYFPAYFGFNWDALEDSLNDFSWMVADAYILLFRDFGVLEARSPEVANSFLEIIKDVASNRQRQGRKPLKLLVLVSTPS